MGEAAEVMRRKIAAINAQDAKEALAAFSPDSFKEVPGTTLQGADQIVAYFSVLWEAFPDGRIDVTHVVEEGSVVAIRGRSSGTHLGTLRTPGGDIPPTGRRIDFSISDLYEVAGGVIVASYLHFDRLELLEQLGVVPAPTPA
jgi:predicted ester cyclase